MSQTQRGLTQSYFGKKKSGMKRKQSLLNSLKGVQAAREREQAKQAKIANMSEAERVKQEVNKLKLEQIRRERIDREAKEAIEIRNKIKRLREEEEAEEKREFDERRQRAVQLSKENSLEEPKQQQKPSKKRVRFEVDSQEPSPKVVTTYGFFDAIPRSQINRVIEENALETQGTNGHATKPTVSIDDVLNMASYRIFHADVDCGAGLVGSGMRPWSEPQDWHSFVKGVNDLMLNEKNTVNHFFGEYNYVIPGDELEKHLGISPTLMHANGNQLDLKDIVFRITRPDMDRGDEDDDETEGGSVANGICRYRRYKEMCMEMTHVLNAAASGFGVPCYAAFVFKSDFINVSMGKRVELYGSLYAFKRGEKDMNDLISSRVREVTQERNVENQQLAMSRGVEKFVKRLILPVIFKQAKQLVLNFDCKPTNVIILSNKQACLTDFDTALYSLNVSFASFETCFFVNLLLMCTHIRAWVPTHFADAFVKSLRGLLLELCIHSRSSKWLFDARIRKTRFTPGNADTGEKAKNKLESVINSYFIERSEEAKYATPPRLQAGKSLVSQILKFALTGSSVSNDAEICKVLGECV